MVGIYNRELQALDFHFGTEFVHIPNTISFLFFLENYSSSVGCGLPMYHCPATKIGEGVGKESISPLLPAFWESQELDVWLELSQSDIVSWDFIFEVVI